MVSTGYIQSTEIKSVAAFAYDTQGRRIQVIDAVSGDETRFYYSDNWQVLLETDYDSGTYTETDLRTFVYGNYIDEVLLMDNGSAYYYLHDHLYSPVALLNSSGSVVKRYEYDAYGKVEIMDASYVSRTYSQYGKQRLF